MTKETNLSVPALHFKRIRVAMKNLKKAIENKESIPQIASKMQNLERAFQARTRKILSRYNKVVRHRDSFIERIKNETLPKS